MSSAVAEERTATGGVIHVLHVVSMFGAVGAVEQGAWNCFAPEFGALRQWGAWPAPTDTSTC